jgi:hypothetical protein
MTQNASHEPSFACTNFCVGESSQAYVPITQIMATSQNIYERVLVDGAPKGLGRPPLKCNPRKLPTPKSQMAPTPQEKAKTQKTIIASKPPLHQNLLGKLDHTKAITVASQMACILQEKVMAKMTISPSKPPLQENLMGKF